MRHLGERKVCMREQFLCSFHTALGHMLVRRKSRRLPE
jgi:hypothetical protein